MLQKRPEFAVSTQQRLHEMAEAAKAREDAKVYQMKLWPDDKRAMPLEFIACALFAAVQPKKAPHMRGEPIACIEGYTVSFTGRRLTQVHADIYMGVAHLARAQHQGYVAVFKDRQFLRMIGRESGSNSSKSLRRLLDDLLATAVRVTDPSGRESYSGSVLSRAADKVGEDGESTFAVEITRDFCKLFDRGFSQVDWSQRVKLLKKPLAQWLQLYYSVPRKATAVQELHRLSGGVDDLRFFRRRLRRDMELLRTIRVISDWCIDEHDAVHVAQLGKQLPARLRTVPGDEVAGEDPSLPVQPALPLPAPTLPVLILTVSARARTQYQTRFGRQDVDACLTAWNAWLRETNRTAEKPDAAFLGFARRWVSETAERPRGSDPSTTA